MDSEKQAALEAKELLTLCLANAIDQALTAQIGTDWFAEFAKEDSRPTETGDKKPIVPNGKTSVHELDMQALLKFFLFRTKWCNQVLEHHHFSEKKPSEKDKNDPFSKLVSRLIYDFRNRMEAHNSAIDIEKERSGHSGSQIYSYRDAVRDMRKLASIFPTVTDAEGIPYYQQIAKLIDTPTIQLDSSVPEMDPSVPEMDPSVPEMDPPAPQKKKMWPAIVAIAAVVALLVGGLWWKLSANVYRDDSAPFYEEGQVSIQPFRVYYEKGELVAECYIINSTDDDLSRIDVEALYLQQNGTTIAAAGFGRLKDERRNDVEIEADECICWEFRFPKNAVLLKDVRLENLETEAVIKYK